MPSGLDPSDFVDAEYQAARRAPAAATMTQSSAPRAPTREEVDAQVTDVQTELARLKQAQEQLERERAALEETKRRQNEWKTGREEMLHSLTRGVGLLEEAEFSARQDAEQMAKTIGGLREALNKVQAICDETWTAENYQQEMTRALTTLENARMEWNSARLKFPLLSARAEEPAQAPAPTAPTLPTLANMSFLDLCRLGLAFTWPLAVGLAIIIMVLLLRSK